jgi:serine/threonine-protein kinase
MPKRLGKYEVRAKIAEGGMATVFVGRGPLGTCAIKMIRDEFTSNRDFVNMFLDEAKIVSRLRHPNIVQLFELGVEGPRLFLAMELLFGQSLWYVWDACRERGVRLRYDVIAWIGARVAEGLHFAHEARDENGRHLELVHRDVNATNIFVTYDGQIKIIDFGLAKAINRVSKTAAGVIKGKVAYMAPEQAIGAPIDRRTDIFALGTTLWELSVDRRLFKANDEIETLKRVHAADVPNPLDLVESYPPALWNVLKRALARDAKDRYATAADLARDLDAVARSEGRAVAAQSLAEVMAELFAAERERQARWMADASAADRPAPLETLKPPSDVSLGELRQGVPPPPSLPRDLVSAADAQRMTFSPPARPPLQAPPSRRAPEPPAPPVADAPLPRVPKSNHAAIVVVVLALLVVGGVLALVFRLLR